VLIGGWAVYLLVNSEFRRRNGFNYVGSRDIDIGFRLEPDWDKETLMESKFASALRKLKNLGFKPVSFRQQISYDYETLEILTGADLRNKPEHEIFRLYVDMVVNVIPECFEETFGFTPVDEPLLDLAFHQGKDHTVFIDDAGVRTVKSEVLLAMKLNSLPNRTRDDKRLKDISDIYALSWYSGTRFNVIKHKLYGFYPREMVREVISSITDGHYCAIKFIEVKGRLVDYLWCSRGGVKELGLFQPKNSCVMSGLNLFQLYKSSSGVVVYELILVSSVF